MSMSSGSQFPDRDINRGHLHFHTVRQKIYIYIGGGPASSETYWAELNQSKNYLHVYNRVDDPEPGSLGSDQAGYAWYNTTEQQLKMWDGEQIVIVG